MQDKTTSPHSTEGYFEDIQKIKNLIHDIASPLTMIQMKLDKVFDELQHEQQQELINRVEQAMDGIHQVNRMVLATKKQINEQRVYSSFSAIEELHKMITLFSPLFEEHQIKVEEDYQDDKMFLKNVGGFHRIFSNIIMNSVESLNQRKGQQKYIKIRTDRDVKNFSVSIIDNGKGINPNSMPLLFHRGYSTKGVGRGLGLANAKDSLIDLFNATIHCESELGFGASFIVKFPARA